MKQKTKAGFTLIELLVVVLIIGILAAVALPQYNQAVLKAQMTSILPYIRAVQNAQEAYFLENDHYATNLDDLVISVTCPSNFTCDMQVRKEDNEAKIQAYLTNRPNPAIVGSFNRRGPYEGTKGLIYCWANPSDPKAVKLCSSMGGKLVNTEDGEYRYAIYH